MVYSTIWTDLKTLWWAKEARYENSCMIPFILNSKSDTNYSIRIQNSYLCGAD